MFIKRNSGTKLKIVKRKIKADCISCVCCLIWEHLYQCLKNSLLLFNGYLSPEYSFVVVQFTDQIFQCCTLKSFSYYPHFTIMFQGGKRWLQLMWFKMASFVLLKQSWLLYNFRALYWAFPFSSCAFFKIPFSFSERNSF